MNGIQQLWRAVLLAVVLAFSAGAGAQDQPSLDTKTCEEVKDPDTAYMLDLCSAHLGCAMVVKIQKACTAVRGFVDRLGSSIGQGVKTLFGFRKEVQPENVWDAVQTDNTRRVDQMPETAQTRDAIKAGTAKAGAQVIEGRTTTGNTYVYIGDVKDGKASGFGTRFVSTGLVARGQWADGSLTGPGEYLAPSPNGDSQRLIGSFSNGRLSGDGVAESADGGILKGRFVNDVLVEGNFTFRNGARLEGRFDASTRQIIEGSKYAADGSLSEKGTFRQGQLYVGERYANGQVVATVDRPREQKERT